MIITADRDGASFGWFFTKTTHKINARVFNIAKVRFVVYIDSSTEDEKLNKIATNKMEKFIPK